jgi:hypothetical protein
MRTHQQFLGFGIVLISIVLSGCGDSEPSVSWEPVSDEPSPDVQSAIESADQAADELGGKLMSALQGALAEGGPAQAIKVCQEVAPSLAEEVGAEQGVRMGRTSYRLRNQNNRTPSWARAEVQQQSADMSAYVSSEGVVGRLRPIPMMPLCAQCHGTDDEISLEVRDALSIHYPADKATGFRPGDIRGYFWVEVDINQP